MFGYVKTDFPNLYIKDTILYRSMYCSLCKGIGQTCGEKARLVLNYDLTFLSVLLHNVNNNDVKIEKQHCIIHPLRKRPIALVDDLTKRIACLNVILAYHKLNDDVVDSGKGKLKRIFFKKSYKKAKSLEKEMDRVVKEKYDQLLKLEKQNCDSADIVADPFGAMMQELFLILLQERCTDSLKELAYYLGKWIYLIDALDDFDKDKKKGDYNVFVNEYKNCQTKESLLNEHKNELLMIFTPILNKIGGLASQTEYKFNHDLIDNVFYRGLCAQTKKIMEKEKCKNTSKF